MIHPTAIISERAEVPDSCQIGPYCVIGPDVVLGEDCVLISHVVIEGHSQLGARNECHPFSVIGGKSQDMKYQGEPTSLIVGSDNVFREHSTIHRSTADLAPTRIGSHNLFLVASHVAHDCVVGDHVIFSNNATIAGHVTVDDYAILSGYVAVHQFCRIGKHSMCGGMAKVTADVPPFMIIDGSPAETRAVNQVGLSRRGFSEADIRDLKMAWRKLFLRKIGSMDDARAALKALAASENQHVQHLLEFLVDSKRGFIR